MNVIAVVEKYLIRDLAGLVGNYYKQKKKDDYYVFGYWDFTDCNPLSYAHNLWNMGHWFDYACLNGHVEMAENILLIECVNDKNPEWKYVPDVQKMIGFNKYSWQDWYNDGIMFACFNPKRIQLNVVRHFMRKRRMATKVEMSGKSFKKLMKLLKE